MPWRQRLLRGPRSRSFLLTLHDLALGEHDAEEDDHDDRTHVHQNLYDCDTLRAQHDEQARDRYEAGRQPDHTVPHLPGLDYQQRGDESGRAEEQEDEQLPSKNHFFTPGISIAWNLHALKHLPHP